MGLEDIVFWLYKQERGSEKSNGKRSIPDSAYPWVAKLRTKKIISYVSENDTVLEYGVGFGWNIALVECRRKIGFDSSKSFEPVVRKNGIEFIQDIATLSDETIDVVICHHELEHATVPVNVLKEILRLLRPEGKLLLFVPFEKGKKTRRYDPNDPYHRFYSWNVQTLGNLVEANGFKLVEGKIGRFGYDRFSAVWADRFSLGEWGFKALRGSIHLVKPGFEVEIVAEKK